MPANQVSVQEKQVGSACELDVETFRGQTRADLQGGREYLAGWLESFLIKNGGIPAEDRTPWTRTGREFVDFYDTLRHVLAWYMPAKMSALRDLGWKIDENVVANIKEKFALLIVMALATAGKGEFNDWFRSYDPSVISRYTAVDYKLQTLTGATIRNVLDFGSGIGRQAFQWCSEEKVTFFSVDAIESLYLLQNRIYSELYPDKLVEYFHNPREFLDTVRHPTRGLLYHLPTWRLDALPDGYFDLIVCVQVLQEISQRTLTYLLEQFRRIVKKGGYLYIRDKEFWMPNHKVRVGRQLLRQGWQLIFRYPGDEGEIEGVPRLWIFTGEDNSRYFRPAIRLQKLFVPSISVRSWRLIPKFLKDYGLPI